MLLYILPLTQQLEASSYSVGKICWRGLARHLFVGGGGG